jgi:hypothetical protein
LVTLPAVDFKVACLSSSKETNDTIKVHCLVFFFCDGYPIESCTFWLSVWQNSKVLTAVRSKFHCSSFSCWEAPCEQTQNDKKRNHFAHAPNWNAIVCHTHRDGTHRRRPRVKCCSHSNYTQGRGSLFVISSFSTSSLNSSFSSVVFLFYSHSNRLKMCSITHSSLLYMPYSLSSPYAPC